MIISNKLEVLIHTIPKTGTRSLKHFFLRNLNLGFENHKDHVHKIPTFALNFYSIIIVRNPFDRMYSLYNSIIKTGNDPKGLRGPILNNYQSLSFEAFLQFNLDNKHKFEFKNHGLLRILKPQTTFLLTKPDKIIKFENLEKGIKELSFVPKDAIFPKRNVTQKKSIDKIPKLSDVINEDIKKKIIELCNDEFDILGYSKNYS